MLNGSEKMQVDALFEGGRFYEIVSEKLEKHRESLHWSQSHLAKLARMHISIIRALETGRAFSLDTLSTVLRIYQLDPRSVLPEQPGEVQDISNYPDSKSLLKLSKAIKSSEYGRSVFQLKSFINTIEETIKLAPLPMKNAEEHYRRGAVYEPKTRSDILESFGRRVRIYRTLRGFTANQTAQKSHTSLTSYSLLESGHRNPSMETVYKVSEGLAISVFALIPGTHDDQNTMRLLDVAAWAVEAQTHLYALDDLEFVFNSLRDALGTSASS
ncbi:hypothetical protein AOE01nite_30440 [Acetobacter oeni]|uniref:HTH cro/C1-type domain-containing protein n=2 Tax=Acetobacter oeni TaxID=304077 RepID=A0A511XPC9_9PROT|nr:helix-turn-helix domain-containing protein [Acetobacter oeni]GBR07511.1 hypothetical protein AA21952_2362 [Acetobacter oeni LMG 21952]GEN64820.1 hypothetical protein AOE01nite_30440 [Acetobacter oeni]